MKNTRKILSVILTAVMLLTMGLMTASMASEVDSSLILDVDMSTFTDKSGKNVTVTPKNVESKTFVGYDDSKVSYATFDDSNENWILIENANATGLIGNSESTIEMWVKATAITGYNDFFMIKETSQQNSSASLFGEMFPDGTTLASTVYGKGTNRTTGLDFYKWNHYVYTRKLENGVIKTTVYVNGKQVQTGETESTVMDNASANIYFGGHNLAKAARFTGGISEIKMYNKVKTADEVAALYKEDEEIYRDGAILDIDMATIATATKDKTGNFKLADGGSYFARPTAATFTNDLGEAVPYMAIAEGQGIGFASGEGAGLVLDQPKISVEMWLQPDWTGYSIPFSIEGKSGDWWVEFGTNNQGKDGYIMVRNGASTILYRKDYTGIPEDKWMHIAITRAFDSSTGTVDYTAYLNGKSMTAVNAQLTGVTDLDKGDEICIADGWNGSSNYTGGFAKVKFYDRILTQARVEAIFNSEKATYFSFEESAKILNAGFTASGTTAVLTDLSTNTALSYWGDHKPVYGTHNNGTDTSAPYGLFNDAQFTNWYGLALGYNSTNATAMREKLLNKDKTTVEMWVRPDKVDYTAPAPLFVINTTNSNPYYKNTLLVEIENGELQVHRAASAMYDTSKPYSVKDKAGQWIHIVVTRDFDSNASTLTYKTYVDGVKIYEKAVSATSVGDDLNSGHIDIGGAVWGHKNSASSGETYENFNGAIAEVSMYDRIATESWIAKTYNAEKAMYADPAKEKLTVKEAYFATDDYIEEFIGNEEAIEIGVMLENSSDIAKPYFMAAAIYDGNKMVDILTTTGTIGENGGTPYVTFEKLADYKLTQNAKIKVFVWYNNDKFMTPCEVSEGVVLEISAKEGA